MSNKEAQLSSIVAKWRRRYTFNYDVAHSARALFFYRWELHIDTAGGTYLAGGFRTKAALHADRQANWGGRKFWVHDHWRSVPTELLNDTKALAKLLGWRRCSNIHSAPLSLQ